jgi:hypothetical protein
MMMAERKVDNPAPTPPALDVEAGREDDWDATREDQNSGQAPQGEKR